jgi:Protein of unknown function (DUF2958)
MGEQEPSHFPRPAPEQDNATDLMPEWLKAQFPPLYSTEQTPDPIVICKYFTPDAGWTWYATEFDGEDTFFGLVDGFERELGYFSLAELQSVHGPYGLPIERDLWLPPTPLSQIRGNE